jgi:tRNA(fMet)-specific endonuclease VapC
VWRRFELLPFPLAAIQRFEQLRALRLNVGLMDLRLGAVALENNLTVVTRNVRDFKRIPRVQTEDWSV